MDLFPIERKFIQPMLLARELCFSYRWCSTRLISGCGPLLVCSLRVPISEPHDGCFSKGVHLENLRGVRFLESEDPGYEPGTRSENGVRLSMGLEGEDWL